VSLSRKYGVGTVYISWYGLYSFFYIVVRFIFFFLILWYGLDD